MKTNHMMVYAWEDQDSKGEVKFGDHFVENQTVEEAIQDTFGYIRGSLGRQKYKFDEGRIKVLRVWNVSEYAKTVGRFKKHSHMDDVIRDKALINRVSKRSEFHRMNADDVVNRVAKHLAKIGGSLPDAALSTMQHEMAVEVGNLIEEGKRTILAELCARFGKTIWSGAVAVEQQTPITIVVSYVKTVFSSFENDLLEFSQFADHVHVDSQDPEYQSKIEQAIWDGKKVIVYLSMCASPKRQERIDWLFDWPMQRLVIIDEADFGVHRQNQSEPLINARDPNDIVLLMTGTNSDRAVSEWKVDSMLSVTYPELLLQKANSKPKPSQLTNFKINPDRDLLAPNVEFYQMGLKGPVEYALANGEFEDELPSWSKFVANPLKAKGFFTQTLQALFLGQHAHDDLNVDLQTMNLEPSKSRVAMMFMPGNTRTESLQMIEAIAAQSLPGFKVVNVSGGGKTPSGKSISNRNAEQMVKEIVYNAKQEQSSVLIIAAQMAQRSFSIPEITELYLAYDAGDQGATIQKMSRTLTPADLAKVGRVFSLSFDPNRDDKFDQTVLVTAKNWAKTSKKSMKESMRDVLKTIDIFSCQSDGAIKIEVDEYLEQALARKSVSRVIGKSSNLTMLGPDMIHALANGDVDYLRGQKQTKAKKGRTREKAQPKQKSKPKFNPMKDLQKAREVVVTIVENLDIIIDGAENATTIVEALNEIKGNEYEEQYIEQEFGVPFDLVLYLFEEDIINQGLVELLHDN